jgi:hypothetical protein
LINYSKYDETRHVSAVILLMLFCAAIVLNTVTLAAAADTAQSTGKTSAQRLAGRWLRPDGGYILELGGINEDGSLKASYFNPRPIKVYRAEHHRKDGKITLSIELRDVNYPGSTYTLQYDPVSDRLKGAYFQAVQKETYYVEFVRTE